MCSSIHNLGYHSDSLGSGIRIQLADSVGVELNHAYVLVSRTGAGMVAHNLHGYRDWVLRGSAAR
jgi:hypothetical protein